MRVSDEMADDSSREDSEKPDVEVTEKKTIRQSCRSYWTYFNSVYQAMALATAVMVYLFIGGGIFTALEAPTEIAQINARVTEQERLKEMVRIAFNATQEEVDNLFGNFSTACENSLLLTDTVRIWTYARAVFFSATVVTTIGEWILLL